VPEGSGNNGVIELRFQVSQAKYYHLWGRVLAQDTSHNSFYAKFDANSDVQWNLDVSPYWDWQPMMSGGDIAGTWLAQGIHTLRVKQREPGTYLDKVLLTSDPNYEPSNEGGYAENMAVCGNKVCDKAESCSSCAVDCGACPAVCGNNKCESGESCSSCATDCGACATYCGDGSCNGNEDCTTCSRDCGMCPVTQLHWCECEEYVSASGPWTLYNSASASQDQCLYIPNGAGSGATATYSFSVSEDSDYVMWARLVAPSGDDNSLFVQLDNTAEFVWDMDVTSQWEWQKLSNRDNPSFKTFHWSRGQHTIKLSQREDGLYIDKLLVTNNLEYEPQGEGSVNSNAYCGNGICNSDEDCYSCTSDCGACDVCGNGKCDSKESCSSCPEDCGKCKSSGGGGSSSGGSSGGSAGISGAPSIISSSANDNFEEVSLESGPYEFQGNYRDGISFQVMDEEHSLVIDGIGQDFVMIELSSEQIKDKVNLDERKEYDVNGGGENDVAITLKSMQDKSVVMSVELLNNEPEPAVKEEPRPEPVEETPEPVPITAMSVKEDEKPHTGAMVITLLILVTLAGLLMGTARYYPEFQPNLENPLYNVQYSMSKFGNRLSDRASELKDNVAGSLGNALSMMSEVGQLVSTRLRVLFGKSQPLVDQTPQEKTEQINSKIYELHSWIKIARRNGFDDEYIIRILLARGWKRDIIGKLMQ